MKVLIDGVEATIIYYNHGNECAADLITTDDDIEVNEDGYALMTDDQYTWWQTHLSALQDAETRIRDIKWELPYHKYDELDTLIHDAYNHEWEHIPHYLNELADKLEKLCW